LKVGTSQHSFDGNIQGDIWKAWHPSGWLLNAIDARIAAKISEQSSGILDVRLAGSAASTYDKNTKKKAHCPQDMFLSGGR